MSEFIERATQNVREHSRGKGHRHCQLCQERIRPGQPAVRVSDTNESHYMGTVRYWLCRRCADQVGDAITRASS